MDKKEIVKPLGEKKIKVLHIIASPTIGGAEKLLANYLKDFDRDKFEVIVGSYLVEGEESAFWRELCKFDVVREPIRIKTPFDFHQFRAIHGILKRYRPNVVHTHGYKTNICGFLVTRWLRVPIVTTVHGWLHSRSWRTRVFYIFNFFLLRHFDVVIAVSDRMRFELERRRIRRDRIVTVKNVPSLDDSRRRKSSDIERILSFASGDPLIGFVGRLEKVKGGEQFVKAAFLVAKEDASLKFVIAGDGPERLNLEKLAASLGLKSKMLFLGFCEDTVSLFGALDLYVLPSLDEGIPLTVLEALASRVPVVATRVGGVPEVIDDGFNGVLVEPDDADSLAKAILWVRGSPSVRKKIVEEGEKLVKTKYNVKDWVRRLESIYSNMANGRISGHAKELR
jgi:glycosyltransferase involved in cell wall biosynthesis